jgi:hypothetical protein
MEMDMTLYDKCAREHAERQKAKDSDREAAQAKWAQVAEAAAAMGVTVPPP